MVVERKVENISREKGSRKEENVDGLGITKHKYIQATCKCQEWNC